MGGKYQFKTIGVGAVVLNKEHGVTRRTTSWCSREVFEQARGVAMSNKVQQEKQQCQAHLTRSNNINQGEAKSNKTNNNIDQGGVKNNKNIKMQQNE